MLTEEIRLIVSDLDGTLLTPQREIPDAAVQMIMRVRDRGIRFTFITGRPAHAVERFVRRLEIVEPIICCNGAVFVHEGKTVIRHSFSLEPLYPFMKKAARVGLTVLPCVRETEYALMPTAWTAARETNGKPFPLWRFSGQGALAEKLTVIAVSADEKKAFAALLPELEAFKKEYSVFCYGENGAEIVASGVDKAAALLELCAWYGISPEQTLAVGDNENDTLMLQTAGIGAAVANAAENTRKAARYHCSHAYTDGVLEAISVFVFQEKNI